MKAIQINQFGGPDVLTYVDIPEPTIQVDEVKVKLSFAGINPFETYIRDGGYAFYTPELPYTMGFDGAGIIEEIGAHVENLNVGDRVFVASTLAEKTTGTYAEKIVCTADSIRKLPETISLKAGAALGVPAMTAYQALFLRGNLSEKDTVLIHGASGGVGTLAVQMAKNCGAYVIGTAGTNEGMELAKKCGADLVLNHHEPDYLKAIQGVDLIIEMLANHNLVKDLEILNTYGRIVVIGNRGSLEFNPRLIMAKNADILGMAIWHLKPDQVKEILDNIVIMLENNALNPQIGSIYPLSEASQAQFDIINKKAHGKILLKI